MASLSENITVGQDEKSNSTDHDTEQGHVDLQHSEEYDFTGTGAIDSLLLDPTICEDIPWSFETPTDVTSYEPPTISSPFGPPSHYTNRRSVSEPPSWHDNTNTVPLPQDEPHVIFHRGGKELGTDSAGNPKKRARRQEPPTRPQKAATVRYYPPPHPRSHPLSNLRTSAMSYSPDRSRSVYHRQTGGQPTPTRSINTHHLIDPTLFAFEANEGKNAVPAEAVVQIGVEELKEIIIEAVRTALHR